MKKKEIDFNKEPELYIDGEKVEFHYSREERRNTSHIFHKERTSFFNKKNRYIHLLLLDIVMLFLIGAFFTMKLGREKEIEIPPFTYRVVRTFRPLSDTLEFTLSISNKTEEAAILSDISMKLTLQDKEGIPLETRDFFVSKQTFHPGETYKDLFIFDKPPKGSYSLSLYKTESNEPLLTLSILIPVGK